MIDVSSELLAFLKEEEVRARHETLLDRAETSLNSYNGEPYGDEESGRSQVVTRDVAEVIDQMQISVLRVFVSGDRTVEFEPSDPEQEQAADDATETIHRQFARKGYSLLHDWFKDGNLTGLGVVKTCVERKRTRQEQMVPAMLLADPELLASVVGEEVKIIEADEPEMGEDGIAMQKVAALVEGAPEFKDYLVPLEEFRVSPDARDLDDAAYVAHATAKSLSELVEMGFDKDALDNVQSNERLDQLAHARTKDVWENFERTGSLRRVLLMEEYVRFDADGDGIAERLCVHRVGDTVLRIEPVDYHPFVAYCPFPMPGRLYGHSLADKVGDIQRINTVLLRGHLDGQYCNLAPGYIVPDSAVNENTYDDLMTVRPNRIIRTTGSGQIEPERRNDTSASSLAAMQFMIGMRESRTGITRLNQGIDADALNKTATGTALMQAQGQQMEEYLARNFGESLCRLMRLKLRLYSRYGQQTRLRVDGEFRDVDPGQWPEEMDLVVRVGLGSGKKEQRLANRMMVLQIQREVMMAGLPIVGPEQIYKSISGVVRDASLGSPADFVIDPSTIEPPTDENGQPLPPEPSPEEQQLQAEMAMQQAKIQGDQQLQAAKLQGEQQMSAMKIEALREEAQIKAQLARDEATAAAELSAAKAQAELELAERKFQAEMMMAERRMEVEAQRAARDADRRDYETDAKISQNRKGGDLDK